VRILFQALSISACSSVLKCHERGGPFFLHVELGEKGKSTISILSVSPLRAKYVRDLAIRGRAERTQETYTSTSVIWRAYHICQLKDEHMLTLARLRTDAACDSLRVADATRYSYKTSDKSNIHAASSDFCILTAAWAKAGTSGLTENYRSLTRR
jgi:hypothetical protein